MLPRFHLRFVVLDVNLMNFWRSDICSSHIDPMSLLIVSLFWREKVWILLQVFIVLLVLQIHARGYLHLFGLLQFGRLHFRLSQVHIHLIDSWNHGCGLHALHNLAVLQLPAQVLDHLFPLQLLVLLVVILLLGPPLLIMRLLIVQPYLIVKFLRQLLVT